MKNEKHTQLGGQKYMVDRTQLEDMVDKLNVVKQEFFKDKEGLKVSIRKDVVAVELKSILQNTDNYLNLKKCTKSASSYHFTT